jgi:hypothetical protein
MVSVCACGLDKSGLLDVDATGDDGGLGGQGVVIDATGFDVEASTDDGARPTDEQGNVQEDAEAGPATDVEVTRDVFADVVEEVGADSKAEARGDAPRDAPIVDASRDDAPADAPPDSLVDAPPADGPGPSDAPTDSAPWPIVWDGGAITDPQFYDTDWISFCVALVACGEIPSISACLALLPQPSSPNTLLPPPDTIANVNNAAPACKQVRKALGGGAACPRTTADSCSDPASFVTCRWGFTATIDCGALGMVCSYGNGSGNVGCGFGDCSPSQEGETYCVGPNYVATCTRGRYQPALDCQTFGGRCIGPAGTAQCQGTGGTACTGGGSCVGTSVVECMGGLLGSVDCTALYDPTFTCLVDDAGSPTCAGGTSCDPAVASDTCTQGTQATFCNLGATGTYDCTGNGYSGCSGGHCVP